MTADGEGIRKSSRRGKHYKRMIPLCKGTRSVSLIHLLQVGRNAVLAGRRAPGPGKGSGKKKGGKTEREEKEGVDLGRQIHLFTRKEELGETLLG